MSENTAKDLILDIIGRLRSRKARPDFENICHMASRKHGLSLKETEEMMSKLVQENIVIRVTYKGRTSYRNAAKCSKTRMHAELLNKKAATKLRFAIQSRCSLNNNNNSSNNNNNNNNQCEKHRGINNNNINNNNNNCTNNTCDNSSVTNCVHSSNVATTNQSGAGSCDSKTCSHSAQNSGSNNRDPCVATITNNNNNNNLTTTQALTDNCNGGGDDDSGNGDDDDSADVGVSREQIELWWHAQGFESALAKIDLNTVIQNELIAKNIQLLPNGKLALTNSGSTTTANSALINNTASLSPLVPFPSESLPTTNSSSCVPCSTPDTSSVSLSCQAPLSLPAVAAAAAAIATDTSPVDKQKVDLDRNGICGSGGTGDTSRHPVSKNCLPKPPCKRGRPVSRRKKFLKTHGPDFQAEMPVAIHGITKCDFCQRPADMNCGSQEEELLCCKDCNTKAHPSCMNYTPELAVRAHRSPWQCQTCKVCCICKDSGNAPAMLICDSCDKGFHMQCLYPPLDKSPSGELAIAGHWVCSMCSKQDIKDNDNSKLVSSSEELITIKKEACTYGPPTPSESPEPNLTEMQQDFPRKRNLYDGPYPDVTDYTIEDVVQFFQSKGFAKEALAFREQEIDGKSLLLMKRDDVLVGLRDYICLGPALKIYKHVERLQWASE